MNNSTTILKKAFSAFSCRRDDEEEKSRLSKIEWVRINITGRRVLVVGVGMEAAELAAQLDKDGCKVTAVLPDLPDIGGDKLTVIHEEFLSCGLASGSFDSVILVEALGFCTGYDEYKKARRVLNQYGRLIISVPLGKKSRSYGNMLYYLQNAADNISGLFAVKQISLTEGGMMLTLAVSDSAEAPGLEAYQEMISSAFFAREAELAGLAELYRGLLTDLSDNAKKSVLHYKLAGDSPDKSMLEKSEADTYKQKYEALLKEYKDSIDRTIAEMDSLKTADPEKNKLLSMLKSSENELSRLTKKYDGLANSKLGKIQLAYWKWRSKGKN